MPEYALTYDAYWYKISCRNIVGLAINVVWIELRICKILSGHSENKNNEEEFSSWFRKLLSI